MTSTLYFPRHLHLQLKDGTGRLRRVDENELLAIEGPKIILGEPGMGKSELIHELGRRLDLKIYAAMRFMVSTNPIAFISQGKPLLIDGLDEAMARREGDAIDTVFAKLEQAGNPDFILCCRSREWQSRSIDILQQTYDFEPHILTLEPLSRDEAFSFLAQRHPVVNADQVLDHLEAQGIAELYKNPLTLGLAGRVAESDTALPATRAGLFERVCTLVWPEHDPKRNESGLGKISEEQALAAAGAISAGLLLAGADAVTLANHGQTIECDVRLAELETLPGAGAARAVFTSKLFHSVGLDRAKPIHRVIAEYLGARWLSHQVKTTRAQRRLLAQLQGAGSVPASLRGLHAWLAFHSPSMAKEVISADPFGVLRYGETSGLTVDQAHYMLDALEALSERDPYFRSQDWGIHSATGLMSPHLRDRIEAVILPSDTNPHFRSLLVEAIQGTALAPALSSALEQVMLSDSHFYGEREAAVQALLPYRDRAWWQQSVIALSETCRADSFHLARHLVEEIEYDVPNTVLINTLLASMGLLICPLPRAKTEEFRTFRYYRPVIQNLAPDRLVDLLNLFSEYASLLPEDQIVNAGSLAGMMVTLVTRVIAEGLITTADTASLWEWLGVVRHLEPHETPEKTGLQRQLDMADELRRAVQMHALYGSNAQDSIRLMEYELQDRLIGLRWHPRDLIWFVERLSSRDVHDAKAREDWCEFMQIGCVKNAFDVELRKASGQFQRDDELLEAFINQLENPEPSVYLIRAEQAQTQRREKEQAAYDAHRGYYLRHERELRAGELTQTSLPARIYLGHHSLYDRTVSQKEALVMWIGQELAEAAMSGLEATLHRHDLPPPSRVAESFADGIALPSSYSIIAGLLVRQRSGLGFSDLAPEVVRTGLLICFHDHLVLSADEVSSLRLALEPHVVASDDDREKFAREWLEPSLRINRSEISGLHTFLADESWQRTGAKLAKVWLTEFPTLPEKIENVLISSLLYARETRSLEAIAQARSNSELAPISRMLSWRAVDVIVRFESVAHELDDIVSEYPEFIWHLRQRLRDGRRGSIRWIECAKAKWIVSRFRLHWPHATMPQSSSGDQNPYDATEFLNMMISSIADDTTLEAIQALQELIAEPRDGYTNQLLHRAAEQRQKWAEEHFAPLPPKDLNTLLNDGPPANMDDLRSIILEELDVVQKKLLGDDLDQVKLFWNDNGIPYDENTCRDRLAGLLSPQLAYYGLQRITEADMPNTMRADLAFARGSLQLPMEVKGQWHSQVWTAAQDQLEEKYLIDWRAQGSGIYCVFWFGVLTSASNRRLQVPPNSIKPPTSATEMRDMLVDLLPHRLRAVVDVVVLNLEAGAPRSD